MNHDMSDSQTHEPGNGEDFAFIPTSFLNSPPPKSFPQPRQNLCTPCPSGQDQLAATHRSMYWNKRSVLASCYSEANLSMHQVKGQ